MRLTPTLIAPEAGRPYAIVEARGDARLLDLAVDPIVAGFQQHGAILFRGFAPDLDGFHAFTAQFCSSSVFNESPDRQMLDEANNIQSVNGGSDPFPPHPELSREPWKPDACFFHCLKAPLEGGETTIVDGIEIVRQLPTEIRDGLAARRLLYLQPAMPWQLRYWFGTETPAIADLQDPPAICPYRFTMIGGQLMRFFTRPALHRPMFAEGPAFGNFLLFARYYNGRRDFPLLDDGREVPGPWIEAVKQTADRLTVPIAWQDGDLLMLDNSRFMHGRNTIADPSARLIASYFGYLSFAPGDPEEPADPVWRRQTFKPPQPSVA